MGTRNWFAEQLRRLATNKAIDLALKLESRKEVVAHLLAHPAAAGQVAQAAVSRLPGAGRAATILCAALVEADAPPALGVIRALADLGPAGFHWDVFPTGRNEILGRHIGFVLKHGVPDDLARLLKGIKEKERILGLMGLLEAGDPQAMAVLSPILADETGRREWQFLSPEQAAVVAAYVQRHGSAEEQVSVARKLRGGSDEPAIPTPTWRGFRDAPEDKRALLVRVAAERLPDMDAAEVALWASHFRRNAALTWLPSLRAAWAGLEKQVRLDGVNNFEDPDPSLMAAADAVVAAMGWCAACDEGFHSFQADRQLDAKLTKAIDLHNKLVTKHDALVQQYTVNEPPGAPRPEYLQRWSRAQRPQEVVRVRLLRQRLQKLDGRIHHMERLHQGQLSPGFQLLRVLHDGQRYPLAVRQGAAWGLYALLTRGRLDDPARLEIFEALFRVFEEKGDDAFCERVVQLSSLADAADLTEGLRDGLSWIVGLTEQFRPPSAPSPEAPPESPDQEPDGVPAANAGDDLPPAPPTGDPALTGDAAAEAPGLSPAQRLAKFDRRLAERPTALEGYESLPEVVDLLCRKVPRALAFLHQYPLRLMPLGVHQNLLGKYVREGAGVHLWTRYNPPENVGQVKLRYLQLEDRSRPNCMGIYYRLLRHPLLALPVIYHEHLHYGGPRGDPQQAIPNETDVLVREIVFIRGLVAELAPRLDADLPKFEAKVVRLFQESELAGELPALTCNLLDENTLTGINNYILGEYGRPLTDDQLDQRVDATIQKQNHYIRYANIFQHWCPEVTWPEIGDPPALALDREYRKILRFKLSVDHSVDQAQQARILGDLECRRYLDAWDEYNRRPGAGAGFRQVMAALALDRQTLLQLIVKRFDLGTAESRKRGMEIGRQVAAMLAAIRGAPEGSAQAEALLRALAASGVDIPEDVDGHDAPFAEDAGEELPGENQDAAPDTGGPSDS